MRHHPAVDSPAYVLARIALVALWAWTAWQCLRRGGDWQRFWRGAALAAVLYGSMRAFRWNYLLLEWARAGLRSLGVYDERIWFKVMLASLLTVALLWALHAAGRLWRSRAAMACFVALLLQGALLACETLSLDDALPRALVTQPGRYLYEGAMAAVALLAARRSVREGKV
ncbi:MAG: hypothetical protein RIT25_2575 [Planctomycetota bacterium]